MTFGLKRKTENTAQLEILETGEQISFEEGEFDSLAELLVQKRIGIGHSCGFMGTCGTCLVELVAPADIERNELEEEIARDRGLRSNERLSCQLPALNGMKIKVQY